MANLDAIATGTPGADKFRVTLKQPLQPPKYAKDLLTAEQVVEYLSMILLKPGLHPVRKIVVLNDTLTATEIERTSG